MAHLLTELFGASRYMPPPSYAAVLPVMVESLMVIAENPLVVVAIPPPRPFRVLLLLTVQLVMVTLEEAICTAPP